MSQTRLVCAGARVPWRRQRTGQSGPRKAVYAAIRYGCARARSTARQSAQSGRRHVSPSNGPAAPVVAKRAAMEASRGIDHSQKAPRANSTPAYTAYTQHRRPSKQRRGACIAVPQTAPSHYRKTASHSTAADNICGGNLQISAKYNHVPPTARARDSSPHAPAVHRGMTRTTRVQRRTRTRHVLARR